MILQTKADLGLVLGSRAASPGGYFQNGSDFTRRLGAAIWNFFVLADQSISGWMLRFPVLEAPASG